MDLLETSFIGKHSTFSLLLVEGGRSLKLLECCTEINSLKCYTFLLLLICTLIYFFWSISQSISESFGCPFQRLRPVEKKKKRSKVPFPENNYRVLDLKEKRNRFNPAKLLSPNLLHLEDQSELK